MRQLPYTLTLLCLLGFAPQGWSQTIAEGITPLDPLSSDAYAISTHSNLIIGSSLHYGAVWNMATGLRTTLPVLSGRLRSRAYAASADGSVVVGDSVNNLEAPAAAMWRNGTPVALALPTGANYSMARAVSADGRYAVGYALHTATEALRWDLNSNIYQALGNLRGPGGWASATGINHDGSVVVGWSYYHPVQPYYQAFIWRDGVGMQGLGFLGTDNQSIAYGITPDGDTIVGASYTTAALQAVRWENGGTTGPIGLGFLPQGTRSIAYGISADGQVIVGEGSAGAGVPKRGFRWTMAHGIESIEDWLRRTGVTNVADVTADAKGANEDGSLVVGRLLSGHAYIAKAGAGIITPVLFNLSLSVAPAMTGILLAQTDLILNGARSMPMRRLLGVGQSQMWAAADFSRRHVEGGYDNHQDIAELGYAYGISPRVQLGLALGASGLRRDLGYGGKIKADGHYLVPELMINVYHHIYASLAAFYQYDNVHVSRAYDNAGSIDFSRGKTHLKSHGARLQLDWKDAVQTENFSLTPNLSYTYLYAQADGFAESHGSFPVRWNRISQSSSTFRIGADAAYNLTSDITLLGRVEGAHRVQSQGKHMSGEIIGVGAFSAASGRYRQEWLRTALGAELKVGEKSKATALVNMSTEGRGNPDYWLYVNYRMFF